jgi:hypothetical protein
MFKPLISKNVNVDVIDINTEEFNTLNVPQSAGLALPATGFSIPTTLSFGILTYNRLLDDDKNPRKGLGIGIILKDGTEKCVPISSFTKSFYTTAPKKLEDNSFETRNLPRKSVITDLQDVDTLGLKPSELAEKYLAGKSFEKATEIDAYIGEKYVNNAATVYTKSKKNLFKSVASATANKPETAAEKKARLKAESENKA